MEGNDRGGRIRKRKKIKEITREEEYRIGRSRGTTEKESKK